MLKEYKEKKLQSLDNYICKNYYKIQIGTIIRTNIAKIVKYLHAKFKMFHFFSSFKNFEKKCCLYSGC